MPRRHHEDILRCMAEKTKPSLAYFLSMVIAVLLGMLLGGMLTLVLIILIW